MSGEEVHHLQESILPTNENQDNNLTMWHLLNSEVFDHSQIADNSLEDTEIEVLFDSKMPPLIPLTVHDRSVNKTQQNTRIPTSLPLPSQRSCPEDSQNSKYSKLVADLQSLLECPVCSTIINTTPVHCCSNGHPTCLACWTRCHRCPVCRVPCHSSPPCYAQTVNTIIGLIPLPCENKYQGCGEEGSEAMIGRHQEVCPYREEVERGPGCQAFGCRVGH